MTSAPRAAPLPEMIRAAAASSAGTLGSLALAALGTKIVASLLGPQGIGLVGALRQVQQAGTACGTLGGQSALVQGLSSREGDRREAYLRAALRACLVFTGITLVALLVLAAPLARGLAGSDASDRVLLVRLMAPAIAFGVAQAILAAILAAHAARARLALAQVAGAAAFAALAWPCAKLVLSGHAWALAVLFSALTGIAALSAVVLSRREWLAARARGEDDATSSFVRTAGTLLASQVVAAATLLALRALIVHRGGGLAQAGLFDAAWSVGMTYMTVALVALNTYYLPELSRATDREARGALIERLLRFMLAAAVPAIIAMIVLRPLVLRLLYSADFLPALDTFRWMVAGDALKVVAWVLGIPMLAFGELRALLLREIAWNALFFGISATFILTRGSIEGVGVAFLAGYAVLCALNLGRAAAHGFSPRGALGAHVAAGLAIVALASWSEWSSREVRPSHAVAWIVVAIAYATFEARSLGSHA